MASSVTKVELGSATASVRNYCLRALPWITKGSLAVLDQGLISGSNFMIGVLLARWLVPEQYGAYALAFSIFLFLSGFHNALLLEPMSVFGPASYDKCLPAYLKKLVTLHFGLTVCLGFCLAVAVIILRHFHASGPLLMSLSGACIAVPLVLLFWLFRRAAYLKLAPGLAARGAVGYCLALACLFLLLKHIGWLSGLTAFLMQSVAGVVAVCLLFGSFRLTSDSHPGPSASAVARQHWQYGRWAVGTQFVYWLSGNAYYVIVAAFLRIQDVAALRALQNFTLPFSQFLSAISLLLLPWASRQFAEEGRLGLRRRVRQITLLFVGLASAYYLALVLFGSRIIEILYAGRYTGFATLIPLVAAPMVVLSASQGSMIALQAMQSPSGVFFAYTFSGAVTILAGVPLTRYWGLPGAVVGMTLSYLIFLVLISYKCQVQLRKAVPACA